MGSSFELIHEIPGVFSMALKEGEEMIKTCLKYGDKWVRVCGCVGWKTNAVRRHLFQTSVGSTGQVKREMFSSLSPSLARLCWLYRFQNKFDCTVDRISKRRLTLTHKSTDTAALRPVWCATNNNITCVHSNVLAGWPAGRLENRILDLSEKNI